MQGIIHVNLKLSLILQILEHKIFIMYLTLHFQLTYSFEEKISKILLYYYGGRQEYLYDTKIKVRKQLYPMQFINNLTFFFFTILVDT